MNYDRIILELLDRISALEDDVSRLKSEMQISYNIAKGNKEETGVSITNINMSDGRDTTKYILDGKKYGKNRLVLAIVQKYMQNSHNISAIELCRVFDKSLQGSLGVVRTVSDAKDSYSDYERRFFCQPNEIIHTSSEDCVVCTQWGKFNIDNIIARAEELGIIIKTI